jgi:hypothetical protein
MRKIQTIGTWRGVTIETAVWDSVIADVDLSFACMFTHELGMGLTGGLRDLDETIAGMLSRLRQESVFRGDPLEMLLINEPPPSIAAKAVMVIGMGEPSVWTTAATARAAATAVRTAMQLGAVSAAFAPSLLDAGLSSKATERVGYEMMDAVMDVIDAQIQVASLGLARAPSLQRWVFDAGEAHFDKVSKQFGEAFSSHQKGVS